MQTFQASTDFSSTQGYRNWWYLDGTGVQLVWNPANNRWRKSATEDYPSIYGQLQHPGPSHDALRRWIAPVLGTITISGQLRDWSATGGDGVLATVKKNGVTLWSQTLLADDVIGVPYSLNTSAAVGDVFDFLLNRISTWENDWTVFDPRIELNEEPGAPIVVGAREIVQTPAQRISAGLQYWPDGMLDARKVGGTYVYSAPQGGSPSCPVRTTGPLSAPYGSPQFQPFTTLQPFDYVAGGPVYRDLATGMLLMVYHAETWLSGPSVFTATLGLAKSTDCGNSWTDLGIIIQPQDRTQHCDTNGGTVAVAGNDLRIWYKDRINGGTTHYLCCASAPLASVLSNARAGTITPFFKWDGASFSQPGLGGASVPLEIGNPANGWFCVAWNTFRQKYILVATDLTTAPNTNLIYSDSPDGITWSSRQLLETDAGVSPYPSLIGLGNDPKVTDQQFWVYYLYGPTFDWDTMELSRRLITLN